MPHIISAPAAATGARAGARPGCLRGAALAAPVLALLLGGCGGSSSTPACFATFSGNFSDTASSSSCASLDTLADGGVVFNLVLHSAVEGAPTNISVNLPSSNPPGSYSPETVGAWSAIGINTNNCEFAAGSAAVPVGSFSLEIAAVGTGQVPHGNLEVTQFVKAPPLTDCGAGDTEQLNVTF